MEDHLYKAGLFLAILIVVYKLVETINAYRAQAALKNATGAQVAIKYPQWDRIYGFDLFRDSLQSFKEHRMLERTQERFKIAGSTTFSLLVLGRTIVMTTEPQNLKVIQALDQKKWGLGERRKTAFKPLLGDGEQSTFSFLLLW